jgi:hypothetical protein
MKFLAATLATTVAALSLATAPAQAERWHYLIDQRLAEHERILFEGVRSGSITYAELQDLRRGFRFIVKEVRKAKSDGYLSHAERDRIRALQDRFATALFNERNDGQRRW